jgi:hypothetical protein
MMMRNFWNRYILLGLWAAVAGILLMLADPSWLTVLIAVAGVSMLSAAVWRWYTWGRDATNAALRRAPTLPACLGAQAPNGPTSRRWAPPIVVAADRVDNP